MKYVDENGLLYLVQKIKTWDAAKVDAVSGKGLSTNDYTTEEKTKLGNALTSIPSEYVTESELSSYGYQTSSDVQSAITTALNGITGFDIQIVNELPVTGTKGVFYLMANSGSGSNVYDEYIWITVGTGNEATSKFEKIGTTAVDLSGYVQSSSLNAITNLEIDSIISTASNSGSSSSSG